MKTLVLYRSKSGFVKKYAEWLAEELHADLADAKTFSGNRFADYDAVVFGGGLYVSGIYGLGIIKRNLKRLQGKRVAVFASGASPPRPETVVKVRNHNFSAEQQAQVAFFYMRGGFDYGKLKPVDKVLMRLLKWRLMFKREKTPDERGMLLAYRKPQDFTRRENIRPLVKYIRGIH